MRLCINCNKETSNKRYCSLQCSASGRISSVNKCKCCNQRLGGWYKSREHRTQLCQSCYGKYKVIEYGNKTKLESILECSSYASKHKFSKIRQHAHRISRIHNLYSDSCQGNNCNYNKHTELCHKIPIGNFDDHILLKEINSIDNIVFLCPCCHWELDNL